jgi:hypothetical protein
VRGLEKSFCEKIGGKKSRWIVPLSTLCAVLGSVADRIRSDPYHFPDPDQYESVLDPDPDPTLMSTIKLIGTENATRMPAVWLLVDLQTRKIKLSFIKSTVLYYLFETVRIRIRIRQTDPDPYQNSLDPQDWY